MQDEVHRSEASRQLVSFIVGDEEFGIDILKVQEIIRPTQVTTLPNIHSFVEGIINLRGRIVPVISLRDRFGLPHHAEHQESRIVVVEIGTRVIGFRVDGVREVLKIEEVQTEPPPELACSIDTDYIRAVARLDDRLLLLLDLGRILAEHDAGQLELAQAA